MTSADHTALALLRNPINDPVPDLLFVGDRAAFKEAGDERRRWLDQLDILDEETRERIGPTVAATIPTLYGRARWVHLMERHVWRPHGLRLLPAIVYWAFMGWNFYQGAMWAPASFAVVSRLAYTSSHNLAVRGRPSREECPFQEGPPASQYCATDCSTSAGSTATTTASTTVKRSAHRDTHRHRTDGRWQA
jgi:hypothetical protein